MRKKPTKPRIEPEYQTGKYFFPHYIKPVPEFNFTQRHGTDNNGRSLRSGISAAGNNQRNK